MEDVLLGYLGQKLEEEPGLDIRSSRFGGAVVWNTQPAAESSVQRKDYLTCGICGEHLVLFVQLSAGYGDYPKRSLYVFGCRTSACGLDVKAWRVLRSTGPLCSQARQKEASPAEAKAGGYASYVLDNSDDWGTDDWSVPGGASLDADAEIEALLAARSKASPQKSKQSTVSKEDKVPEVQDNASFWLGVRETPCRPSSWPCLSLSVDYEPWEAASSGDHEHELYQRYLQSELAGNEDLSSGPMPKELEAEAAKLREEAGDSQPSGHEAGFGDEDEDDEDAEEAIRAGDKTAKVDWMMRFHRRISRSPQQVLRYCWGGEPLWLQAPPGAPPGCCCGAARCFEMQLLPTLPSRLAHTVPSEKASALTMEWGTLVVFTCSKDCPCEDPREEFLVIQPAE